MNCPTPLFHRRRDKPCKWSGQGWYSSSAVLCRVLRQSCGVSWVVFLRVTMQCRVGQRTCSDSHGTWSWLWSVQALADGSSGRLLAPLHVSQWLLVVYNTGTPVAITKLPHYCKGLTEVHVLTLMLRRFNLCELLLAQLETSFLVFLITGTVEVITVQAILPILRLATASYICYLFRNEGECLHIYKVFGHHYLTTVHISERKVVVP